jgi:hypothetical protein
MQQLQGAGAQVAVLQHRGDNGWLAQRRQFCRRRHAGAEQGKIVGNGLDKQALSVSDSNAERKAGQAHTRRFAEMLQ